MLGSADPELEQHNLSDSVISMLSDVGSGMTSDSGSDFSWWDSESDEEGQQQEQAQ